MEPELTLEVLSTLSCLAQGVLLRLYVLARGETFVTRRLSALAQYPVDRSDVERALDELAQAEVVDVYREHRKVRRVTRRWRLAVDR